jgi:hypothetical protein
MLFQKPLNTPKREHRLFTLSLLRRAGKFNGYSGRNVAHQNRSLNILVFHLIRKSLTAKDS